MTNSDLNQTNPGDQGVSPPFSPMTFADYARAGFGSELLPILPPDAVVNPLNSNRAKLEEKRGKVPGYRGHNGWSGMADWPNMAATPSDHRLWDIWGCGIGLLGRNFPAIDIDIMDDEVASEIQNAALELLGPAPIRFGRGARRLLVYAGSGFSKAVHSVRDPDSTVGEVQAVEVLAEGQQYVIEGIHPKTNSPYRWVDDRRPSTWGAENLTRLTPENLASFWDRVATILNRHKWETIGRPSANSQGGRREVDQSKLLAPSLTAIREALFSIENVVDYSDWLNLGRATKAAAGLEDEAAAFQIWGEWSDAYPGNTPDNNEVVWQSLRPPHEIGWHMLADTAVRLGDGSFSSAAYDFDALEAVGSPSDESGALRKAPPQAVLSMFDRYIWIEKLKRVCDRNSGEMLDREQFNVRNSHIGHPADAKRSAWGVLTSMPRYLHAATSITYRPGGEEFVVENLPGLSGRCLNVWKPLKHDLPASASDDQVREWLDHVAFVLPVERERNIFLDWLAWIIQNPGEKPNWAVVIGSTFEGVDKDLMLEPARVALGAANIREITADDLWANETDYLEKTRLLLVEEMQSSERKAMENKLKSIIASPPYTLRINIKFVPRYEIPNLIAVIFFTNMANALSISREGRRYFVAWNENPPREAAYYEDLVSWFEQGGANLAARWLLDRDVSAFKAKGPAPATAAREDMQKQSRPALEELIGDAFDEHDGPFQHRLIALNEIMGWLSGKLGRHVSKQAVCRDLKKAGAAHLGRPRLGDGPSDAVVTYHLKPLEQVYARPDLANAKELKGAALISMFWDDRRENRASSISPDVMFT